MKCYCESDGGISVRIVEMKDEGAVKHVTQCGIRGNTGGLCFQGITPSLRDLWVIC